MKIVKSTVTLFFFLPLTLPSSCGWRKTSEKLIVTLWTNLKILKLCAVKECRYSVVICDCIVSLDSCSIGGGRQVLLLSYCTDEDSVGHLSVSGWRAAAGPCSQQHIRSGMCAMQCAPELRPCYMLLKSPPPSKCLASRNKVLPFNYNRSWIKTGLSLTSLIARLNLSFRNLASHEWC